MTESTDSALTRLRHKIEMALDRSSKVTELELLLDRMIGLAAPGSPHALYAHRHMAELRLRNNPWRAALHLKQVLEARPNDDVLHAMMGLCQALLGNYRAAVNSYRRALRTAPDIPWYHHNLGHLLDVALGDSSTAEKHLRQAHELEPEHDEISASLAHCLAQLGHLDEAAGLADGAIEQAPRNPGHQKLKAWIDELHALKDEPSAASRGDRLFRNDDDVIQHNPATETVWKVAEQGMRRSGFTGSERERARTLWNDFLSAAPVRVLKPEVYAAAVEYAICVVHARDDVTQAEIAKKYGVARGTLCNRYLRIRRALDLETFDERYR